MKKTQLAMRLGLAANVLLALAKTSVGILAGSPALLAEGINSTSDVAYYVLAGVFMRLANQPADDEHPYGHQQFETIAALTVGAFVITTGIAVFWNAVEKTWAVLRGAADGGAGAGALFVALLTIVSKVFLTWLVGRLGKETRNPMVEAMAYDHRNDLFSATAAAVGIYLGQRGLAWVDPLAAALVAVLIFRTGLEIVLDASNELMDTVPSRELVNTALEVVRRVSPLVHLETMQAHRFGPNLVINMTVGMDGRLTIAEGDRLSDAIEQQMQAQIPRLRQVHIHYHPLREECKNLTTSQVLLRSRQLELD